MAPGLAVIKTIGGKSPISKPHFASEWSQEPDSYKKFVNTLRYWLDGEATPTLTKELTHMDRVLERGKFLFPFFVAD